MGKSASKKAKKAGAIKEKEPQLASGKSAAGQVEMKVGMPPVFKRQEFLEAFESGVLQRRLANYLEEHDVSIPDGLRRSWNNSYAYLDIVLRGDDISDDIEVICECPVDASFSSASRRADAILLWPHGKGGLRRAVVVELKQWDQRYLADEIAAEKNRLKNPFDQVRDYADLFEKNGCCGEKVHVFPCVLLHNIPLEECGKFKVLENRHEDVAEFYQGQVEGLRSFLKGVQSQIPVDALAPLKAIERAKKSGYWRDGLPCDARGLRDALVKKGYARILLTDRYDFEPTSKGEKLGIVRFEGYDVKKSRCFVICKFTDKAMKKLAKKLSDD